MVLGAKGLDPGDAARRGLAEAIHTEWRAWSNPPVTVPCASDLMQESQARFDRAFSGTRAPGQRRRGEQSAWPVQARTLSDSPRFYRAPRSVQNYPRQPLLMETSPEGLGAGAQPGFQSQHRSRPPTGTPPLGSMARRSVSSAARGWYGIPGTKWYSTDRLTTESER